MCDAATELLKKPKYKFKISTIHRSTEFLKVLVDTFFDDPFSNCSKETLVDWPEYQKIQRKAFMEYLEKIFTKDFLGLRTDKFYYAIMELKLKNNYKNYRKFFKNLKFFEKNTN